MSFLSVSCPSCGDIRTITQYPHDHLLFVRCRQCEQDILVSIDVRAVRAIEVASPQEPTTYEPALDDRVRLLESTASKVVTELKTTKQNFVSAWRRLDSLGKFVRSKPWQTSRKGGQNGNG